MSALPIELLYFTAAAENNHAASVVRCEWATASESNNDYFGIERSKDGIAFSQIAAAPSKAPGGNSSVTLNYEFIDTDFPSTINHQPSTILYYRLKQVDYDGQYSYSATQSVYLEGTPGLISIFPTLVKENLYYEVTSEKRVAVTVKVIDMLGREVLSRKETLDKGFVKKTLNIAALSSGSYMLQVITENQETTQKQFVIK